MSWGRGVCVYVLLAEEGSSVGNLRGQLGPISLLMAVNVGLPAQCHHVLGGNRRPEVGFA